MALPKIPEIYFIVEKNGQSERFYSSKELYEYCLEQDDLSIAIYADYYSEPVANKESVHDFLFWHLEDYLAENGYKFRKEAVYE